MYRPLDPNLFLRVMREPVRLKGLSDGDVDQIVRFARRANLLANLAARVQARTRKPDDLADVFEGAAMYAKEHARRIRWEMTELAPLVERLGFPVLVLKGGAYLQMDLESAAGRLVSDLDLLVPHASLYEMESAMLSSAYSSQKQDDYDQHYYREWMHELPPMVHIARGTTVDLHHNIAPPVSRLKIDAAKLIERAVPLENAPPFMRLGDEDLVLHLCVHMFHDGELDNALRELFDLDALLRRFGADEAFWGRLMERAGELGVKRPLYFGTTFAARELGTPVPEEISRRLEEHAPNRMTRALTEYTMWLSILPDLGERPSIRRALSQQLLFIRAHWLRMPTGMLIKHLWTQARRRGGLKKAEQVGRSLGDV